MVHDLNLIYSFSGLFVGLMVGLTGVGGGSLMTPILVLLFHVPANIAVGTDLLYAAITKAIGTTVHHHQKSVNWKITGLLSLGSIPSASLTLIFLHKTGFHHSKINQIILIFLSITLLITSLALIFRKQLLEFAQRHANAHPSRQSAASLTIFTGAIIGILVSLTSVGAGVIGITVLLLLYPFLPIKKIISSDIAHAVPLTFIAGLGYWWLGSVNWSMLISLLIGSIPGIIVGSLLSARVPEKFLRYLLASILMIVSFKILLT